MSLQPVSHELADPPAHAHAHAHAHHIEHQRSAIVAVDGSACSKAALMWAFDNFATDGSVLHLVHCYKALDVPAIANFTFFPSDLDQQSAWLGENREVLKEFLQVAHGRMAEAHGKHGVTIKAHLIAGDPREVLIDCAKQWHASAIIMGARGQNKSLKRLFLGSVSDYVVHNATNPVVIVPGPLVPEPPAAPLHVTIKCPEGLTNAPAVEELN